MIVHELPDTKNVFSAYTKSTFLSLRDDLKEVDSYRNIVLLPPYPDAEIMVTPSLLPTDLAFVVLASSTNMKSH